MGGCLAPIPPPRLTRPSREPGRGEGGKEPSPAASGGGSGGGFPPRQASSAGSRESRTFPPRRHLPPGSCRHPPPQAATPHPLLSRGPGHPPAAAPWPGGGVPCRKKGETHRRCLLRGCRRPPGAAPSRAPGRRARGGGRPAGPAASSSIGAQPQILHRGWGGYFQKKIPPLPRSDPSDGQGAYKSLFCRERGADGAAPGLHGPLPPQSRAPAPPNPGPAPTLPRSPPPPRPMAGPGRGLGRPGVGRAGEAAAAAQAAGRLLPGRGERVRAWKPSAPACPGRGLRRGQAGRGGGFLETLAKYSQRIGAFLEMRRRRQPRPMGAEPGVLQTRGGAAGTGTRGDSPLPIPRWPGGGSLGWASLLGGGQDSSTCAPGIPQPGVSEWGRIYLRFRLAPRSVPPTFGTLSDSASRRF